MTLKKHHKWMIGGFSSVIIVFMIVIAILLNGVIMKQQINHNELSNRIDNLQADTQSKLNELTENLIETQKDLTSLNEQFGSIDEELDLLKASAGEDFSGIIEDAVKSVVTIRTDVGQGTGFIIDQDGYIVTNAHVLSGGKYVQAITYEQETINAQFIGYDAEMDLALLKISGNYEEIKLANSDDIQVGEKVIAIGNPLGLQFSVSDGIVSAVHRAGSNGINVYIQTTAELNPGNSGGPLIDTKGEVIGINNFKISDTEGLGFALESNYIKETINDISNDALGIDLL